MEKMLETLAKIGFPNDEIARIKAYYTNDPDGLRDYLLYVQALFDDRHEYI